MSRQGRYRKFRSVGSVLPRVLKGLKLDKVLAAQPAVNLWPQIAGPKTAEHTRAVEVDGKTLVVVVDSPPWIVQLRFLKPQLLRKIDARIGKGLITDLRFVLGHAQPSDRDQVIRTKQGREPGNGQAGRQVDRGEIELDYPTT